MIEFLLLFFSVLSGISSVFYFTQFLVKSVFIDIKVTNGFT